MGDEGATGGGERRGLSLIPQDNQLGSLFFLQCEEVTFLPLGLKNFLRPSRAPWAQVAGRSMGQACHGPAGQRAGPAQLPRPFV